MQCIGWGHAERSQFHDRAGRARLLRCADARQTSTKYWRICVDLFCYKHALCVCSRSHSATPSKLCNCERWLCPPRSPTQLGETVRTLASESSPEDSRVTSGATLRGARGKGAGRFYLNVTGTQLGCTGGAVWLGIDANRRVSSCIFAGFPFPLGPLFARQTFRYEVRSAGSLSGYERIFSA